jgi:hypothetical protein
MSDTNNESLEEVRHNLDFAMRAVRHSVDSYVTEGGVYFMLWSLLIPLATLLSYLTAGSGAVVLIWFIVGAGGGLASRMLSRRRNPEGPGTTGGVVYHAVWRSLGGALAVLGVASLLPLLPALPIATRLSLNSGLFVVGLTVGIAFMVAGSFSTLPWLKALGVAWWAAALLALFAPPLWAPAVIGGATLPLCGAPGIVLQRRLHRGS